MSAKDVGEKISAVGLKIIAIEAVQIEQGKAPERTAAILALKAERTKLYGELEAAKAAETA